MALTRYLLSGARLTTDAHDQRPRTTDPTRSSKFRVFHLTTIYYICDSTIYFTHKPTRYRSMGDNISGLYLLL